jgi:hypothetical protein
VVISLTRVPGSSGTKQVDKKKRSALKISSEIHRKLAIISSILDRDMGELADEILDGPVDALYKKAVAEEANQVAKKKAKPTEQ